MAKLFAWSRNWVSEPMSDFLDEMAASAYLRADGVRSRAGVTGLTSRVASATPALPLRMSSRGFDLIAEPKLASPADGRLAGGDRALETVVGLSTIFNQAGAAALSILTEPTVFGGGMEHLETVTASVDVPVMRKDFIVDPIQVIEARAAGASGVLLIARILDGALLDEMTELTLELGMFALVEVFDRNDLELASSVFDKEILIGVNSRNLITLEVEPQRHSDLVSLIPNHLPGVAESGIGSAHSAAAVAEMGYRMALVGTSLVRDANPGAAAVEMIDAGRRSSRLASGV